MKNTLLAFVLLLSFYNGYTQPGSWVWAKSAGGTATDYIDRSAVDNSGNFIAGGNFKSATLVLGNVTLTNSDTTNYNVFLAKYDSSGSVLWARSFGGSLDDRIGDVKTDASGNIYITGYFFSKVFTIGSFTFNNLDTSGTYPDIYIAKYNAAGTLLWAKRAGAEFADYGNGLAIDLAGNVYITGAYMGNAMFGNLLLTTNLVGGFYVVKMNPAGTFIWAVKSEGSTTGRSICVDALCNVYAAGDFNRKTISFGSQTITKDSTNNWDPFIVKYDSSGTPKWAQAFSGEFDDDRARYIATGKSGDVFLTGYFSSNSLKNGSITLTNSDVFGVINDAFVACLSNAGVIKWAKKIGGAGPEVGYGVASNPEGDIFITGYYGAASLIIDTITLLNSSTSLNDIYVAKLNAFGNVLWAKTMGGSSSEFSYTVASDNIGNVYVSGLFYSPSITIGNTTLTQAGSGDMFVLKLKDKSGASSAIVKNSLDINEVLVYPNPAVKNFNITFPSSTEQVQLINMWGEVLQSINVDGQISTGFESCNAGVYFIRVIAKGSVITKKVVVRE